MIESTRTLQPHNGRTPRVGWTAVLLCAAVALPLLAPASRAAADAPAGDAFTVKPILVVTGPAPGVTFQSPRAIALDVPHDEVLLANTGEHRIEVFSLGGDRRARFIHRVESVTGQWVDGVPIALAVDRAGRIFVSDALAPYVDVLDYRGRSQARVALPAAPGAKAAPMPGPLAITPEGDLLVAERGGDSHVHRFGPDLRLKASWGTTGLEPGQLSAIVGIAAAPGGEVVVVCAGTKYAVQIFSPAGEYQRGFGVHEIGPGNFSLPSGVAVCAGGRIWVSDELRQIVQVFDPSGTFVQAVGAGGRGPGEFGYPSALACDGGNLVAVAEREGRRFQLLRIQ